MRKDILLVAFCILTATSSFAKSPDLRRESAMERILIDTLSTDSLINYLSTVDLNQFVGHPVDSLLNLIPNAIKEQKIMPCSKTRAGMQTACQLVVTFYYKLSIRIVVQQFTHLTPYDPTRSWNISDFRQEKIACILVGLDKTIVNDICN